MYFRAKDNFTFKCHRSNGTNTTTPQDIYAVSAYEFLKYCQFKWQNINNTIFLPKVFYE